MATTFPSGAAEEAYIRQRAAALGLDPEAVLAVAAHEGVTLPSEVGDSGTSFGPWQLHAGGALDSSPGGAIYQSQGPDAANAWANSQAGIDYALGQIKQAVGNARGLPAVADQIVRFEKPSGVVQGQIQPGSIAANELSAAISTYQSGGGPSTGGGGGGGFIGGAESFIGGALGGANVLGITPGDVTGVLGVTNPFNSVEKLIEFLTSWRFAEVIGGIILLIIGLVLLGKQFTASVPGVAAVAKVAPGL